MLTQCQIDEIVNASRQADEGPAQFARRIEAAVMKEVIADCEMAVSSSEGDNDATGALMNLSDRLRCTWQDCLSPRPSKS